MASDFKVKIDDAAVAGDLKKARREAGKAVRAGVTEAANRAALPRIKRAAHGEFPAEVVSSLSVKGTQKGAYVTTRGARKTDRIAGLLEYGGIVTTILVPRSKRALVIGKTGEVRASVTGPRKYTGKGVLGRAASEAAPAMEAEMLPAIMRVFDPLDHTP